MTDDDQAGGRPLRGVVEVEWDGWEDDGPRSRAPWIVGTVLIAAVTVVAGLTWWALGVDDDLDAALGDPEQEPAEPAAPEADGAPTADALLAAIPDGVDGCVPPPDRPDGLGADGTVRLECPRPSEPDLVTFTLFTDAEARDAAFDDTVALLELDPGAAGDCALGQGVVHGYAGARGRGQVACRAVDDRVDIAWTDGAAPVLAVAGGFGSYAAQYEFWSELVGRTDGDFPLPREEALLDQLPDELITRCERDLDLAEYAGGVVAVTCEPAVGEATVVSSVRFADADAMTDWIEAERAELTAGGAVADTSESACRPDGRGPSGELPPPWLGATPYRQGTSTGTILCHTDADGFNVLTWTRADSNIGSIAVSDGSVGEGTLADLAAWWEAGGHRP